jgi:hypothetical protein
MAIEINPAHKGKLRAHFGVKAGDTIPASDLKIPGGHSVNALKLKKQIVFAKNAKKWDHSK